MPIALAQNKINGQIAKQSWGVVEKKPVKLQYIFDGENLTLTHVGGIVNAGAESTVAEYSEKNGVISLKIRERYGDFGPADSLMSANVSYKLIGKFGESIKITIDDSNTEGGGSSYAFSFKLKKTQEAITIMPVKKLLSIKSEVQH